MDTFVVEGIHTSIPLHQRIMVHPDFRAGRPDPHFRERLNAAPVAISVTG